MYTGIGIVDTCTKQDILINFRMWLWDRYDWLGHDQIDKIMAKADQILEDSAEYDYLGHRNLYNQIIGA